MSQTQDIKDLLEEVWNRTEKKDEKGLEEFHDLVQERDYEHTRYMETLIKGSENLCTIAQELGIEDEYFASDSGGMNEILTAIKELKAELDKRKKSWCPELVFKDLYENTNYPEFMEETNGTFMDYIQKLEEVRS